jgi:Natural resistance-associated macrophage protein
VPLYSSLELTRNERVAATTSQAVRGKGKTPMFKGLKQFLRILGPGIITGAADDDPSGIPAVVREHYSKPVLSLVVLLVLIANTINIGAMAAAADLLFPLPFAVFALLFTVIILTFEIFLPYKACARILKWLTLALLAYPLTVFIVAEPWPTILRATFLPHLEFNFQFLFVITGVLGTTISPYMFFWQAATVLHGNGVTNIQTAADAARFLLPLVHTFPNSGYIAQALFATGISGRAAAQLHRDQSHQSPGLRRRAQRGGGGAPALRHRASSPGTRPSRGPIAAAGSRTCWSG